MSFYTTPKNINRDPPTPFEIAVEQVYDRPRYALRKLINRAPSTNVSYKHPSALVLVVVLVLGLVLVPINSDSYTILLFMSTSHISMEGVLKEVERALPSRHASVNP